MINKTNDPIVLVSAADLRTRLIDAVDDAAALEMERRNDGQTSARTLPFGLIMQPLRNGLDTFDETDLIRSFALFEHSLELHAGRERGGSRRGLEEPLAALRIDDIGMGAAKNLVRWWKYVMLVLL